MIYLYKKTHNKTGLQYLGKTSRNPHTYNGSGTYWRRHLKQHGCDITTEILKECSDTEELKYWGQLYSDMWDIVKSSEWANLKPEDGDGFSKGEYNPMADKLLKEKHQSRINCPQIKEKHKQAMIDSHKRNPRDCSKISDTTIYTFYHVDGIVEKCTRSALVRKYGLPSGHISNMIHQPHRIVKGWKVKFN